MQSHGYSLTELENMIPWEKEVYMTLIQEQLKIRAEQQRDLRALKERQNGGR